MSVSNSIPAYAGGVMKYASFDIESSIADWVDIEHNGVNLGRAYTPGRASNIFGIGFVAPDGSSAGYHYREGMKTFNDADYAKSSTGPLSKYDVSLRSLSEDDIKKALGTDTIPDDWRQQINARAGIGSHGPNHYTMMSEGQTKYHSDVVAKRGIGSYKGTLDEAINVKGATPHTSQHGFLTGVIDNLNKLKTQTDTLIGYNIGRSGDSVSGFDIPKLERSAYAISEDLGKRMQAAFGQFNTIDVQKMYERKLAGLNIDTKLYPGANRFNLDVAAEAYGRHDKILRDMIRQRGAHGAHKDSAIVTRLYEAMDTHNLSKVDHLRAVARVSSQKIRKAKAAGLPIDSAWKEAKKSSMELLKDFKQLKNSGAASSPTMKSGVGTATQDFVSEAMTKISKIPKAAYIAAGAVAALLVFNKKSDDDNLLNRANDTANYLIHGTARRDEWISASALQLKGNNRFYRMVDPGMEDEVDRPTDREDRRERKVQSEGTATHQKVQDMLEAQGLGQREYYIEDTKNKVFGYVDFMTKQGIPLEIKTTDYKNWSDMKEPHQEHINQINFDTVATDSPYGYIMYTPRGMPEKQKTFLVYRDQGKYAENLVEAREIQKTYTNSVETTSENLSGFRPIANIFNRGSNNRVANMDAGYNRAKIIDQKTRYANLPIGQSYGGRSISRHSNEGSRGAGGSAYG